MENKKAKCHCSILERKIVSEKDERRQLHRTVIFVICLKEKGRSYQALRELWMRGRE